MRLARVVTNRGFWVFMVGLLFIARDLGTIYTLDGKSWRTTAGQIIVSAVSEAPHEVDGQRYYWDLSYSYPVDGRDFRGSCLSPGETYTLGSRARVLQKHERLPKLARALTSIHGDPSRGLIQYAAARYVPGQAVTVYYRPEAPETAMLSLEPTWENLRSLSLGLVLCLIALPLCFWSNRRRAAPEAD